MSASRWSLQTMVAQAALPWHERFLAILSGAMAALLSLPRAYETAPAARWPLILFLHGRGESGSDLILLTRYGLPRSSRYRHSLQVEPIGVRIIGTS